MSKPNKQDRELDKDISRSLIGEMSNEKLLEAKKFIDNFFDRRRLQKLYDTYVEGVNIALQNTGNGRMYVEYNIDGAVTGRLSNSGANKSKGRAREHKLGVSFHTLPREQIDFNIRDIAVAPEGWDFITADKKAMELRVLAHVAVEKNMIKAFESGMDLHTYSAAMTFNKDPKDITKEERQTAKEVSFLTVYGGTAYTLALKRGIPESQAQDIIDSWMAAYPGVPIYMNTVDGYIQQHKYAKTIFGRRRNLPNIDSPFKNVRREAFRQGLNFTIQSPASDILLCAMIGIIDRLKNAGLRSRVIATVHDSIELISPKSETRKTVEIIYDEMINYYYLKKNFGINLKVPLEIDIEVGSSFGNGVKYVL